MRPRDTGQDQVIRRRGAERSVPEDMDIAVGAFRDPSAGTVQDALPASGLFGLLAGHYGGDQVQRFDIAVEKARILRRDHRDRVGADVDFTRSKGDP